MIPYVDEPRRLMRSMDAYNASSYQTTVQQGSYRAPVPKITNACTPALEDCDAGDSDNKDEDIHFEEEGLELGRYKLKRRRSDSRVC